MKNIILQSPAKVNLFLKVGKKIKNKRIHNIQSLIFLTDFNDEISISKINQGKDIIKFIGRFKNNVKRNDNSVSSSLALLRKKKFIHKKTKYKIVIKKNIPVFSGLGGGSSNAATIVKYFLKKNKMTQSNIRYFSKFLGSDFRIFFKKKKIFQENFFKIREFKVNYNFYLLIIYPFLKSSTKDIYSRFRDYELIKKKNKYKKSSKLELVSKLKLDINSLESVVISKFPIIEKILEELEILENCEFSRVTGSGSACFGLFLNKKDGTAALKRIKKRFPRFLCVLSKTI